MCILYHSIWVQTRCDSFLASVQYLVLLMLVLETEMALELVLDVDLELELVPELHLELVLQ